MRDKNKLSGFRILTGTIGFLTLQTCMFAGDVASSPYVVPEPAGEISLVDGQAIIRPELSEAYIPNPGIGWQRGPQKSAMVDFPETVAYSDRRKVAWKILNPAEGVYHWDALDAQLLSAVESGQQFSFRVYTMMGEVYGGHMVPDWVIDKGAVILGSGEPDYSNCVYQQEWGRFVGELRRRYDGNSGIAFIDISGYGDFSEWSWRDEQTEWDAEWQENYLLESMSFDYIRSLDGQARRRLADMFIGGDNPVHQCRSSDGKVAQVGYSYSGFENTQLIMPYAGIVQSIQYVFSRRSDVGFRHDCLGRDGTHLFEKIGSEILKVWMAAPVIYELCGPDEFDLEDAKWLMQESHASIVHDNGWKYSTDELKDMMLYAGYRYFLEQASVLQEEESLKVQMNWKNLGYAPNYPRMGQRLTLNLHLLNYRGKSVITLPLEAELSSWMPSSSMPEGNNTYVVTKDVAIPLGLPKGAYLVGISIVDLRTGLPIQLAFGGRDVNGIYVLVPIEIE